MERIKFIRKIYFKFIIQYLIVSFIVFYILRYLIVILQESIKEGILYNPFITSIQTEITETKSNEKLIEYRVKYKKNGIPHNQQINKDLYNRLLELKKEERDFSFNIQGLGKFKTSEIELYKENENIIKTTEIKKENKTPQEIKERHLTHINNIYTSIVFLILLVIGFIIYVYKKIQLHNYIMLPYDFNIFQVFGNEQKPKKIYDKFLGMTKKGELIYKNTSKTNYDLYLKESENIKQKIAFKTLEIQRYKNNQTILKQVDLVEKLSFEEIKLKENKIHIGYERGNNDKYLDIDGLNHTILIGESGSGKSVFVQNLLVSFFHNQHKFEKFIMVDPKRVELSRYEVFKKVDYYEDMEKVLEMLENLQKTMYNRLEKMKEQGLVKSKDKFILLLVDEFRTLKNNRLEQKQNKQIEKILIDLIQKCRRTNIRIILRGQKCDTQNISSNVLANIQTRILLKTQTNDNINKTIGRTDELEKYNLTIEQIKGFNKGRGIYKDGDTGEVILFQSPFFDIQNEEQKNFMYSLLEKKESISENVLTSSNTNEAVATEIIENNNNVIEISEDLKILQYEQFRTKYWEKSKLLENTESKGKKVRSLLVQFKKDFTNKNYIERDRKITLIKSFFQE